MSRVRNASKVRGVPLSLNGSQFAEVLGREGDGNGMGMGWECEWDGDGNGMGTFLSRGVTSCGRM